MAEIKPRENDLKKRWQGVADQIPVNDVQHSFDSEAREKAFIEAQFNSPEDLARYRTYRDEWYRRAKEFDPGPAPLAVVCELVSTCNLGCSMCYTITPEFQDSVVGATRMLPWPVVKAVIDECAELGVPSMLFSWRGESTLYRVRDENFNVVTFPDVLAYARKRGILEITSLTHGQTIDADMAARLVEAEPSWISISLDGLGSVYNKLRTPPKLKGGDYDAFEVVAGNIRNLVAARDKAGKTRPRIRTNTIFPAIANDPKAYRAFMETIGVDWVTVNELLDFRGENLPPEAIKQDWACQYPFQRLTVSANGVMLPCTGAHNEEDGLVLGRYRGSPAKVVIGKDRKPVDVPLRETTLAEAWTGPKLESIRALHKSGRRVEIDPGCRNCRHGAVHHGAEWIPEEWDMDKMEWRGEVIWRE